MSDPVRTVLAAAFRNVINETNIEAGYERFAALTGGALDFDAFRAAVAEAVRRGLIREPIRLPEGALQCHWHLELTSAGVAAARAGGAPDIPAAIGSLRAPTRRI